MLFAIAFGNPWMLLALSAGIIPIVLHMLRRRRFQETRWAAMQFLSNASRRTSRRTRLEQLILLATRILTFVLLAAALARPYTVTSQLSPGDRQQHRIFAVDTTYSMAADVAGSRRFDAARTVIARIIEQSRSGDSFQLTRLGQFPPYPIVRQPSVRGSEILGELDRVDVTDQAGDLLTSLRSLNALIDSTPIESSLEVVLLSDLQARDWQPPMGDQQAELATQLQAITQRGQLTIVDLGLEPVQSLAITGIQIEQPVVIRNTSTQIRVQVRNPSSQAVGHADLQLRIDDRIAGRRRVELAPDTEGEQVFEYTFDREGARRVSAELMQQPLQASSVRRVRVDVRDHVDVLLVNGRRAAEPEANATFYLQHALEPAVIRAQGNRWIRTQVITESELVSRSELNADVVFLCDQRLVGDRERRMLTRLLDRGGTVVLMPSGQSQLPLYNSVLLDQQPALLPGRLTGLVGSASQPQELFQFLVDELRHPILDPYRGNPGLGLERPLTLQYVRCKPDESSDVRTVLKFDSGDPAIIERRVLNGTVLLICSPWDDSRWNTMARRDGDVLVALCRELIRYSLSKGSHHTSFQVGDLIPKPIEGTESRWRLRQPDGRSVELSEPDADKAAGPQLRFDASGWYELIDLSDPTDSRLWAVNVDPSEALLARADPELLAETILPETGADVYSAASLATARQELATEERFSLTRWLLYAVTCLVLLEQLLAWRFMWGLGLLACLLIAALLAQPPLGLLWLGAAIAGGLAAAVWYLWRYHLQVPG